MTYQWSPVVIPLNCLSIQRLLQQQLCHAVSLWQENNYLTQCLPKKIFSSHLKHYTGLVYRSAIAFPLASIFQLSPLDIASQLVTILKEKAGESPCEKEKLEFMVIAIPQGSASRCGHGSASRRASGSIDFQLSDRSLAFWLQQLPSWLTQDFSSRSTNAQKSPQPQQKQENKVNLFPIQYAHARCCSLLRLGQEEGLIQLKNLDFSQRSWQWLEPTPIPWLSESGNFLLIQPPETNLIAQFLFIVDALDSSKEIDWPKLATLSSNTWLNFYGHCPIWGEIKEKKRQIAQARLGLIALTQYFLQILLEERIRVIAMKEL